MFGRVSINIVTWNSLRYLPSLLASIETQTFKDFFVVVVDNGSTDGTVSFIEKKYPRITLLRNFKNRGFAAAHNQGIKLAINKWVASGVDKAEDFYPHTQKSPALEKFQPLELGVGVYILATNPDTIMSPDFLETLVKVLDKNAHVGSAAGKLLRVSGPSDDGQILSHLNVLDRKNGTEKIIDSAGLKIFKSRQVVDRGAGEKDVGQYDNLEEVFGITGALGLYRLKALEDVKLSKKERARDEYFDETFFAYKEDIDIAWRLRLSGWHSLYAPEAEAYHYRAASGSAQRSWAEKFRDQRKKNSTVKYYSYKNQYLLSVKNDFVRNFLLHLPYIFFFEIRKFLYILFFEPTMLRALCKFWVELPEALRKRKIIMQKRKVTPQEIRKWFQ